MATRPPDRRDRPAPDEVDRDHRERGSTGEGGDSQAEAGQAGSDRPEPDRSGSERTTSDQSASGQPACGSANGDAAGPDRSDGPGPAEPALAQGHGPSQDGTQGRNRNAAQTQAAEARDTAPASPPPMPRARVFVGAGLVLVGLVAWGTWTHWQQARAAADAQDALRNEVPVLHTTVAARDDKPVELTLPGETAAFDSASLYPRATGYIAERRVDIGSRVHKGELLLRISAPDLDQQLAQATAQLGQMEAALVQAQANVSGAQAAVALAKSNKFRDTTLAAQGWQTKQNAQASSTNFDTSTAGVLSAQAGVGVAQANLKAQQATVERLRALSAFEEVRSPMDGVVTARNVDSGDLVSADASSGTPMLVVQSDAVLRVSVAVPQSEAVGVRPGLPGQVRVPEMPDRRFTGQVDRSSVALANSSRAMQVQVDVNNPDGVLRPGLYVDVTFSVPRSHPAVVVPAEALIFNQNGLQVATVKPDNTVRLAKVSIYRDFGTTVELRDGLDGGEQIVLNPPADLQDGARIKPQPDQTPEPRPQQQAEK